MYFSSIYRISNSNDFCHKINCKLERNICPKNVIYKLNYINNVQNEHYNHKMLTKPMPQDKLQLDASTSSLSIQHTK